MTKDARKGFRAKEQLRTRWLDDNPSERDRCPETFDIEAFIRRQEAADRTAKGA
ncbi:hypothetical protein [Azospirillum sp.]|uniref:hypothetical protein n=1 Tax=Azospirillum sp. TaxID=34012 RepID=UPI003D728F31